MQIIDVDERAQMLTTQLELLLSAKAFKYSSWPKEIDIAELKRSAGVYHFYEQRGDSRWSLYVGKGGFGGGKWSLCKRLSQHFQTSQGNTLLGKMSRKAGQPSSEMKTSLGQREVYFQWLVLRTSSQSDLPSVEAELVWLEWFCKSILRPEYTNA